MKVLLINGSPHEKGCTYTALEIVAQRLGAQGVETEIIWIGNQPIGGCIACATCKKTGKCIIDDCVNAVLERLNTADGFVFGAPVHYASPTGNMISFMDRLFYAGSDKMRYKPAAVLTSARRAGTTASLDVLSKYIQFNDMPLVTSRYWNMVYASKPEDVQKDNEGMQIMRELGDNLAWILKCVELGAQNGITHPIPEEKIFS